MIVLKCTPHDYAPINEPVWLSYLNEGWFAILDTGNGMIAHLKESTITATLLTTERGIEHT